MSKYAVTHYVIIHIVINNHVYSFTVIVCPELEHPDNGNIRLMDTSGGLLATYSCDDGYTISSTVDGIRVCSQTSGEWSGIAPICISEFVVAVIMVNTAHVEILSSLLQSMTVVLQVILKKMDKPFLI